jgi:hypothetical protein
MTLKEKFKQWLDKKPRLQIREVQLEVIADEFAIGFAEWFTNEQSPYSITYGNQEVRFSDFRKDYTIKELLEIYKKETYKTALNLKKCQ